jgi:hypothetical protein
MAQNYKGIECTSFEISHRFERLKKSDMGLSTNGKKFKRFLKFFFRNVAFFDNSCLVRNPEV